MISLIYIKNKQCYLNSMLEILESNISSETEESEEQKSQEQKSEEQKSEEQKSYEIALPCGIIETANIVNIEDIDNIDNIERATVITITDAAIERQRANLDEELCDDCTCQNSDRSVCIGILIVVVSIVLLMVLDAKINL